MIRLTQEHRNRLCHEEEHTEPGDARKRLSQS